MHPAEPQNELLQCYDELGNPTEGRPRSEVKQRPPRWWYAVARIWLVNDKGQLLCSKRSEGLSGNPGLWQTYFGGHVPAGLSIKETAVKELAEEAGIYVPADDFYLITKSATPGRFFFESYAVRFNGQPSDLPFPDGEVTEAKWMGMDEYWKDKEANPEKWCNNCPPEEQNKIRKIINPLSL